MIDRNPMSSSERPKLSGPGNRQPGGSGGRLGIIQLVATSLQSLSLCRDDAIRLGAVPAALHVGAMIYGLPAAMALVEAIRQNQVTINPSIISNLLLMGLITTLSLTLLAVNWLRFLLLGPQAAPGLGLHLGRHHLLFLLGAIALGFAALLSLSLVSIPIRLLLGNGAGIGLAVATLAIGMLAIRISLALIAVAIGQPVGLRQAWQASRGQSLSLLVAFTLAELPFFLLVLVIDMIAGATGLADNAPYTLLFVSSLIQVAAAMAQCGVLAAAYRRLIGVRA
jgi:hypothetical protein